MAAHYHLGMGDCTETIAIRRWAARRTITPHNVARPLPTTGEGIKNRRRTTIRSLSPFSLGIGRAAPLVHWRRRRGVVLLVWLLVFRGPLLRFRRLALDLLLGGRARSRGPGRFVRRCRSTRRRASR